MTEMAEIIHWLRETPEYGHIWPSHATLLYAQTSDQGARESKVLHCFGMDHLW